MITNFLEHTQDLTEDEMMFKDDIKRYLEYFLKGPAPVKQSDLCDMINFKFVNEHGPDALYITATRLRKFFNYFRCYGVLPLIATSEGCYISSDQTEIEKQIKSLEERARQIQRAASGMKKLLINQI